MTTALPTLETERLLLRPFRAEDAGAVAAIVGEWKIARMLARVPHPYTLAQAEEWIASHETDWLSGEEITFCIDLQGEAIGAASLRRNGPASYELGYWLGETWWNGGIMTEAASRLASFAFDAMGADRLVSGHFLDNSASGRVLEKCGFRYTGDSMQPCEARGETVRHRDFERLRDAAAGRTKEP